MKKKTSLLEIYFSFAKVGLMTFGGGYAMLPIIERELVMRKKWVTEEEITDYFALSQVTPGAIAVNTATFTGRKMAGTKGALAATFGVVTPSLFIIIIIAALINNFSHLRIVKDSMAGIRTAVSVLIFNAVVKLWPSSVVDRITLLIFLAVLFISLFFGLSPVLIVALSAFAGIIVKGRKR